MTTKKFLLQACALLLFSVILGIGFNCLSENPLPIFKKYDPLEAANLRTGQSNTELPQVNINEIDIETLSYLVQDKAAILVDARTAFDFESGHLPGAINLPVYEFDKKFAPAAKLIDSININTIIVYCSSPTCIDSSLLAQKLYHKGYTDIFVFKGGFKEWSEAGNPIENIQSQYPATSTDTPGNHHSHENTAEDVAE